MGLRDAPLLPPTEVASLPFPVALRTQWGHLVSRPLLVWASVRGFTVVTEGPSDEPTVHTRAIQHFLASCGQDLEWDSWPVRRHIESLCRHRRMALETQLPLTSKLGQFGVKKTRVEWALMCSRGGCAVDASPVLSLVSHFSQRGAFGYSAAYGLPACTLFRGYGLIARALPQAALGLFIPLRTSPGQQTLCPAVRQLSRPLALLPRVPILASSPRAGASLPALATRMLAPSHQPSEASAQRCVG